MPTDNQLFRKAVNGLIEREKELNCLYKVEDILKDGDLETDKALAKLVLILPAGWQYSTVCEARIQLNGRIFKTTDFKETQWIHSADILCGNKVVGKVEIAYTYFIRKHGISQFLPEEQKLLNAVASRISSFIYIKELRASIN